MSDSPKQQYTADTSEETRNVASDTEETRNIAEETRYVIKRNGTKEKVNPKKIYYRLQKLLDDVQSFYTEEMPHSFYNRPLEIDLEWLFREVEKGICDGITTAELDELTADICSSTTKHMDYRLFGGCILSSNLHANNRHLNSFSSYIERAWQYRHPKTREPKPLISEEYYEFVKKYCHHLDRAVNSRRDYLVDYFGMVTLLKGKYLLDEHKPVIRDGVSTFERVPIETPQQMYMRIAVCVSKHNLKDALQIYEMLSTHKATMASPTMFNAGLRKEQLSSCFLMATREDSIEGIADTAKDCAVISKYAGGIGLSMHDIRSSGSYIYGTNGESNGICAWIKWFDTVAVGVDQGGGKRAGAFAVYLEPHHADVQEFLTLKQNTGSDSVRARNLFYALYIDDLFWDRLEESWNSEKDVMWSLFDPSIAKGLCEVYGDKYRKLYEDYEKRGMYEKQVPIMELWEQIMTSQIETGTPYIVNKGPTNRKSNQKNLGIIRSSNLCVVGDTTVYVRDERDNVSAAPVRHLHELGGTHTLWNGYEWMTSPVVQTSELATVLRVTFEYPNDTLVEMRVTPDHRFFVQSPSGTVHEKEAQSLVVGDLVPEYRVPGVLFKNPVRSGVRVHSVHPYPVREPVYCVKDSTGKESIVYNGVLSHNCTEIVLVTKPGDEVAVCNLASMNAKQFVRSDGSFDFEGWRKYCRLMTRCLNNVIDINYYPLPEARRSNMRHRPIGLGIQGLADAFMLMRIGYDSEEGVRMNKRIFEHMYYATIEESHAMAVEDGPYQSIDQNGGAPIRHGQFQFDMWEAETYELSDDLDWEGLRQKVMKDGVRNSETTALMPTASTSIIMGNAECFEPMFSNAFQRRTKNGEYTTLNQYMIHDLHRIGMWNEAIFEKMCADVGSIQNIDGIPDNLKNIYRMAVDIPMKTQLRMMIHRSPFVSQSSSFNVYIHNGDRDDMFQELTLHHLSARRYLKTGEYYLRSFQKVSSRALMGTQTQAKNATDTPTPKPTVCTRESGCESCSS